MQRTAFYLEHPGEARKERERLLDRAYSVYSLENNIRKHDTLYRSLLPGGRAEQTIRTQAKQDKEDENEQPV